MRIAIMGSSGFLGSTLVYYLKDIYDVVEINRYSYKKYIDEHFDIFINANGNSKKFWANQNPVEDLIASVVSVYNSLVDFKYNHYIYMSSIDAGFDHPYGRHKALAEYFVKTICQKYLICRCANLIGKNMRKGVLKSIIDNETVFLSPDSKINFISVNSVALNLLHLIKTNVKNQTINLFAKDSLSINEVETCINKKIKYNDEFNFEDYSEYKPSDILNVKSSKEYVMEIINERVE